MLNRQNKYINIGTKRKNCKKKKKKKKTNAVIRWNKTCNQKQLTPNYILIKTNGNNRQCLNTIKAATHYRLNQKLKFLNIKKQKLNV
jgi:hypothetical protein